MNYTKLLLKFYCVMSFSNRQVNQTQTKAEQQKYRAVN